MFHYPPVFQDPWGFPRNLIHQNEASKSRECPAKGMDFKALYYYMRNYCNLIGLEQWYFS